MPIKAVAKGTRIMAAQETFGDQGWVIGECGHEWWASALSVAVSSSGKGQHGRVCPQCGERGPVRQPTRAERTSRRCTDPHGRGCVTVLSMYRRNDVCGACSASPRAS